MDSSCYSLAGSHSTGITVQEKLERVKRIRSLSCSVAYAYLDSVAVVAYPNSVATEAPYSSPRPRGLD